MFQKKINFEVVFWRLTYLLIKDNIIILIYLFGAFISKEDIN